MSRLLPNKLLAEANASEQSEQIHLVTLQVPGEAPLLLASSNYDAQFGGVTYVKFPLSFKAFEQHSDGTVSRADVTVANVGREIMYYVEQYDGLRGCRLTVKTVFARFLDYLYEIDPVTGSVVVASNSEADPAAYVEEEFIVDSYSAAEQTIVFALDPVIDFDTMLPRRRFATDSCYWDYKSEECLAVSPLPTCNRTKSACLERGNVKRFGGFPGVPRKARRLYF
jgi:lambda family phage minor tail protein L